MQHPNSMHVYVTSVRRSPWKIMLNLVPRNSTQLLNINTTKFQVEREPVYRNYDILAKALADSKEKHIPKKIKKLNKWYGMVW